MKWEKKTTRIPKNSVELQEIIFKNRSIPQDEVVNFLNPVHPEKIAIKSLGISEIEFKKVYKLINQSIKNDEKIVIFGDYDVDGICASAILWQVLFKMYKVVNPKGINHPVPFIPHREKHGYGITRLAIDEIIESFAPKLIITVDNGIVAHEPITYARQKGIEVVVTDHHLPEFKDEKPIFPNANHILHSTQLCGATVAWILARELDSDHAKKLLDLACIATIADQVPLLGANRSFAKYGISKLQKSKNIGLIELFKSAGINQTKITEGTIGFVIAPRINAMGRLEHGLDALRLLCTQNKKQAHDLASLLTQTNFSRQDITKQMLEEAKLQVAEHSDQNILIVFSDTFHEGILGLIAGGLAEKYNKPAIAITVGSELAKASARSIFGVNIVEILREIQTDLVSVGGHPMAAGFSFLPENLKMIREKLFVLAQNEINASQLEKVIEIDCEIPLELISIGTIESLAVFSPYGMRNPQPIYEVGNVRVLEVKHMGKDSEHIKLKVVDNKNPDAIAFDCLGWRMSEYLKEIKLGDVISIVGTLDINQWRDKKYPQVILKDLKLSA